MTVCETLLKFEDGAVVNFIRAPLKSLKIVPIYETIGKTLSDKINLVRTHKYHSLDNTSIKTPEEIRVNLEEYLGQAKLFSQMLQIREINRAATFFLSIAK